MSRIDEALARAKAVGAEHLVPPASSITAAATDLEFPVEEGELAGGVPFQDSNPVPGASPVKGDTAVIEVDAELSTFAGAEKLMLNSADRASVEQYRRLAARLLTAQVESGMRLVMITSALPEEGKTLTSANLALTLSESYKRKVLLIDGDLRKPSVHELFHLPNVSGLNDRSEPAANRKIPLLNFTEHLTILTAGRADSDPMSVLSGPRMRRILDEARDQFEWVIIDTPPVALLTDAHLLSGLVDAVLLVVQCGKTPLPALKTAVEAVGRERVVGVVLNRAETGMAKAGYYYYRSTAAEKV